MGRGFLLTTGLVLLVIPLGCARDASSNGESDGVNRGRLSIVDRTAYVTHYHQGLELARRYQAERALAEFERCLAIRPNDTEARFHKARMLLRLGPAEDAMAILERQATREPVVLQARQLLSELYNSPGATHDAERAAAMRDSVRSVCGKLGDFDRQLRQWLTAGSRPSPCLLLGRNPEEFGVESKDSPLAKLAHAYARRSIMGVAPTNAAKDRHRDAEAERACRQLVGDYTGMAGICAEQATWLQRSQVRFHVGDRVDEPPMNSSIVLDLAQQYFEWALDACPLDSSVAHYSLLGLGHVARDMGDFDQAVQVYSLALDQPGLSPKLQFDAHFNLGLVHFLTDDTEKARQHLKRCASVRHEPALGWLLVLMKELRLPFRPEPVDDEHRRTLRFVDRAEELGVDKKDGAGPSAWCDIDLDGDMDLFVSGCDTFCILYRNDGDHFTDISRQAGLENVASGFSSTFADYDNDGDGDLYIGRNGWSGPARNSLYRNRGDGTFEDVTDRAGVGDPGSSFVHGWGDFDRDGHLDLFVANGITNDGSTNVLYHNDGDGTFTDVTARCGLDEPAGTKTIGFAIGDYDRDGWPDIFVNSWNTRHRLYHNRGDGTFEEVATAAGADGRDHPSSGYVAFLADFDNDTWPDILLTKLAPFRIVLKGMLRDYRPDAESTRYATKLYRNQGNGKFVDESAQAGLIYAHGTMGANIGDVNNDGYLDLYLGTGDPAMSRLEPNAFYLNTRDGRFVDLTRFTRLGHIGKGHGITYADYDFDGDLDIYAPQGGFVHGDLWNNVLFENELGNANHWLSVQLEGTKSNRMGVGAQLTLRAGDLTVYREATAGGAFGSSSAPLIHVGLGNRSTIDSLQVRWPSGARRTYTGVPVNRFIKIVEDATTFVELR